MTTKKSLLMYPLILMITIISYISLHGFLVGEQFQQIYNIMLILLAVVAALVIFLQEKLKLTHMIFAVMIGGMILRLGYMSYTWFFVRAHDVYFFGDYGHLEYVKSLMTGHFPKDNSGQFYQPPLHHMLSAVVATITKSVSSVWEESSYDVIKIVPAFFSCALLVVFYRICSELRLTKKTTLWVMILLSFHPTFIVLAGSVNNDMSMIFFFCLSILATIRWYNHPSYGKITLIAIWIGCSMMTKVSGGMVALFTGPVFLAVLIKQIQARDKNQLTHLVKQFVLFGLICFPLGLWYPIRNWILYKQSFNYVVLLDRNVVPFLYNGDVGWTERFLPFSFGEWVRTPYAVVNQDNNLWSFLVKTSIFGESAVEQRSHAVAIILLISAVLLALLSLGSMVYVLKNGRAVHPLARFGFFGIWLVQILSFIGFNVAYPFRCTMDARYVVPAIIVSIFYLGIGMNELYVRQNQSVAVKIIYRMICGIILIFCCAAALFYA
ncbi:ArnT family glycosyltransferase [Enterococcus sp. AZ192]|uniref:ArnT family glycosyltransferase n=1 Tax=unclassified Enterococcus TaxID=2608891 RepID=UPI003D2A19C4